MDPQASFFSWRKDPFFFNKERTFIWEKVGRSLPKVQFVNAKPFRIGTSAHLRRHFVKPGGYPWTEMCQKVTISDKFVICSSLLKNVHWEITGLWKISQCLISAKALLSDSCSNIFKEQCPDGLFNVLPKSAYYLPVGHGGSEAWTFPKQLCFFNNLFWEHGWNE